MINALTPHTTSSSITLVAFGKRSFEARLREQAEKDNRIRRRRKAILRQVKSGKLSLKRAFNLLTPPARPIQSNRGNYELPLKTPYQDRLFWDPKNNLVLAPWSWPNSSIREYIARLGRKLKRPVILRCHGRLDYLVQHSSQMFIIES